MKNIQFNPAIAFEELFLIILVLILMFTSCGPSAEEKAATQLVDSIRYNKSNSIYSNSLNSMHFKVHQEGSYLFYIVWTENNYGVITNLAIH